MSRISLGEAVFFDNKKQDEEYRASNAWPEDNVEFNQHLMLNKSQSIVIEQLFDEIINDYGNYRKRKQKLLDLAILISNLIYQNRKPISISLNRNDWKTSRYNKASAFIIKLVHILHKKGFIDMKPGYRTKESSRLTRIWATEKLLEYCPSLPNNVIYEPKELVELRDSNDKLKEYKDTAKTYRIRGILERSNKVVQSADIRYMRHSINASLVAIFNEQFTLYGRLHTRGYQHLQGFSEEEREEITINGDPVIELDYQALHPNLLYAEKGIQFKGDPYAAINDNPIARPFMKDVLLRLLNSANEIAAERSINYMLKDKALRNELKTIGITKARPVIEEFKKAHKPISEYFCKGKKTGLKIMNKDAKIALDVVDHFAKKGIPILPVHDSFIVQRQYKKELMHVMKQTYGKHTGGFRCKIK